MAIALTLLTDSNCGSLNHRQGCQGCVRGFNRRPMTSFRLPPFYHATGGAKMGKRGTADCHTTFKPGPCFKRRTSSDNLRTSSFGLSP